MVLLAGFFLFPVIFMFVSSLKPDAQILGDIGSPQAFLPVGDISLQNYSDVFDRVPVGRFLFNSVLVTTCIVGLGLIVNSMCGFALSRLEWSGRKVLLTVVIATLIVPFETIAIPMVYWVSKLPTLVFENNVPMYDFGWLNSYHVQIIPFIANAFSIFLFTQYFSTIPKSLDEAARIDGAGWFTIYRRIIVPLAGPAFATVAILTFLPAWNQYLWPLMVVQQESLRPVMVGMQYFFQLNTAWGEVMAYTSLITLPVLVMFLAFQRAFVSSIASSGVKG
ncbi:carbohydrate ABC transporter permease [Actinotalea sp. K2]|uniref:carbohydrate ABC transporter permease n=1 Tax=Actinotalea sp. K2 TaxID=2939438 RepID=UPI002017F4EC|nr:carbohydrate ABC transporter permease [Actinotalea sp. K2]MCL3861564.1 carbohydrate ABC transporter permease [Actinotalea sp. K2]